VVKLLPDTATNICADLAAIIDRWSATLTRLADTPRYQRQQLIQCIRSNIDAIGIILPDHFVSPGLDP